MEALANKGLRLQSIFGTVVAKALDPLVDVLKLAVDGLGFFLSMLNKMGPVLPIITTAIVAYTAAIIANRAALLATNLIRKTTISTLLGEAAATRAAGLGYKGLLVAMGPVGGTIAVGDTSVGAVTDLYNELSKERGRVTDRLNALNGTPEVRAAAVAEARGRGRLYENTRDDDRVAMLERSFGRIQEGQLDKLSDVLAPLFSEVLNQEERRRESELTALRRSSGFQGFEADRAGLTRQFTNLQGNKDLSDADKDAAINKLIPQVQALGEEAKVAFENQKELFGQTGFSASIEGLAHTMTQATLQTDAELKEQKQLTTLKKEAVNAELQSIKSANDVRDSAAASGVARAKALELLEERQLIERNQMVGELEKSYATEIVTKTKLEALDRKQLAERTRLVEAFDKVDLARTVRNQGIAYKSLEQQLNAEIKAEKKRVSSKSSDSCFEDSPN